jgi:hypothetical protein
VDDPLDVGCCRRIAKIDVAGLITQVTRVGSSPGAIRGAERQRHADDEFPFEDGERLVAGNLFQIDRRRPHDLFDCGVRGGVDFQRRWNQQRIARLVALRVKSFRHANLHGETD